MNSLTKIVFCLTLSRQHLLSSGTYIYIPGVLKALIGKKKNVYLRTAKEWDAYVPVVLKELNKV